MTSEGPPRAGKGARSKMEREKIERINELAHLAKERPLTAEESAERQALRQEYLAYCRENLRSQLDRVVLVDAQGNQTPLKKKGE